MKDRGYYGQFGGCYVPEVLVATIEQLVEAFEAARRDPAVREELRRLQAKLGELSDAVAHGVQPRPLGERL